LIVGAPDRVGEPPAPLLDSQGVASYNGKYSWMFTVDQESTLAGPSGGMLRVSVAVFASRVAANEATFFDPDSTATNANAKIRVQGGIGGVQLRLQWPMPRTSDNVNVTPNEELLANGNWLMLSRGPDNRFRWFRIVSQERVNSVDEITLVGPDLKPPEDTDTPYRVTLFDHVVSVYEKTIPAHESSRWNAED
jgi:hypothetical protein